VGFGFGVAGQRAAQRDVRGSEWILDHPSSGEVTITQLLRESLDPQQARTTRSDTP